MSGSLTMPNRAGQTAASARPHVRRKDNLVAYLFLLPWLVGLFIFTLGPIVASAYLSFTDYDLLTTPEWNGLFNYERLIMRDGRYADAVSVTARYVLISVPLQLLFALLVAAVLNRGLAALSFYRAIYYLPSLLGGSVAIAILWKQVFGLEGIFNQFLALFGVEGMSWIGTPSTALYTLMVLRIWQFGSPMLIFLAGLKQIPPELYQAAEIDGAGSVAKFLRITIPLLTPIIFFNLIMQMISAFQAFTPAFIISGGGGGPADSVLFYTLYLYQQGFSNFRMGYASAMAWILLLIIGIFTAVAFLSSRYWVYYEDETR
jgi:multiple sugar transport system permease protein